MKVNLIRPKTKQIVSAGPLNCGLDRTDNTIQTEKGADSRKEPRIGRIRRVTRKGGSFFPWNVHFLY